MVIRNPRHYTVLLSDLESYSEGNWPRHERLQAGLRHVLEDAAELAGLDRTQWLRQPKGDGELALVPGDVPKYLVLAEFVHKLTVCVGEFNTDKAEGYRLRIRLAIDAGDVEVQPDGNFAGNPPITTARIGESRQVKDALRDAPHDLAVVVSEQIYRDVVRPGPPGVDRESYRQIQVMEKTFDEAAWIHVPGVVGDRDPTMRAGHRRRDDSDDVDPAGVRPSGGPADRPAEHSQANAAAPSIGNLNSSGPLSFGGSASQQNITPWAPREDR